MYKKFFVGLLVVALVTVVFTACGIRDTAGTANGPTVHMGGASFLQTSVNLKKGDMLTLVDDANSQHIIKNGSWQGSKPVANAEPGAPMANLTVNSQGDSGMVGPFNTAGTFHLYCTIHLGMNLTVSVQ